MAFAKYQIKPMDVPERDCYEIGRVVWSNDNPAVLAGANSAILISGMWFEYNADYDLVGDAINLH